MMLCKLHDIAVLLCLQDADFIAIGRGEKKWVGDVDNEYAM